MRSRLAKEPHFDQTISDNGLVCQLEVGFQVELDAASIWERVFTLTGYKKGRKDAGRIISQQLRGTDAFQLSQVATPDGAVS